MAIQTQLPVDPKGTRRMQRVEFSCCLPFAEWNIYNENQDLKKILL